MPGEVWQSHKYFLMNQKHKTSALSKVIIKIRNAVASTELAVIDVLALVGFVMSP